MEDVAIDLREDNAVPMLVSVSVLAVFAVPMLYLAATDEVGDGPVLRLVVGAVGGFLGLLVVGGTWILAGMRRARRLLIDHDGVKLDAGGSKPAFRLAWTELAGVGLRMDDTARRRALRRRAAAASVIVALELIPADSEAVRRHPELRTAWRLGRQRCWLVGLAAGPGDAPPVGELVRRWRPELWRGERSGSLLSR